MCDDQDFGFENWTDNIRAICRQCSEGAPHEKHDKDLEREIFHDEYIIAIAAKSLTQMEELLHTWQAKFSAEVLEIERVI